MAKDNGNKVQASNSFAALNNQNEEVSEKVATQNVSSKAWIEASFGKTNNTSPGKKLENQIPNNMEVELEVCRMKEQDLENKVEEAEVIGSGLKTKDTDITEADPEVRKEIDTEEVNQSEKMLDGQEVTEIFMTEDDTIKAIERDQQLGSVSKNLKIQRREEKEEEDGAKNTNRSNSTVTTTPQLNIDPSKFVQENIVVTENNKVELTSNIQQVEKGADLSPRQLDQLKGSSSKNKGVKGNIEWAAHIRPLSQRIASKMINK
ncbi:hypothetical protein HAX54_041500 [Datura stramonium]|uniref:Uncharacterized protein n=1 Tax=Datura stramonium TaxID=4076 RepID=A0ABS8VP66_DATST|nr:hypothetical protein [Datura stramonium]